MKRMGLAFRPVIRTSAYCSQQSGAQYKITGVNSHNRMYMTAELYK